MLSKPAWPCVKKPMPPKCNNWFCPLWQQELQVLIQLHCRWFSAKTCLGHQKHLSLILDFDSPTPLFLVCFEPFTGDFGGVFWIIVLLQLKWANSTKWWSNVLLQTFRSRAQFMVLLITASHPEAAKQPRTTTLPPPYLTQTRITFSEFCVSFTLE